MFWDVGDVDDHPRKYPSSKIPPLAGAQAVLPQVRGGRRAGRGARQAGAGGLILVAPTLVISKCPLCLLVFEDSSKGSPALCMGFRLVRWEYSQLSGGFPNRASGVLGPKRSLRPVCPMRQYLED